MNELALGVALPVVLLALSISVPIWYQTHRGKIVPSENRLLVEICKVLQSRSQGAAPTATLDKPISPDKHELLARVVESYNRSTTAGDFKEPRHSKGFKDLIGLSQPPKKFKDRFEAALDKLRDPPSHEPWLETTEGRYKLSPHGASEWKSSPKGDVQELEGWLLRALNDSKHHSDDAVQRSDDEEGAADQSQVRLLPNHLRPREWKPIAIAALRECSPATQAELESKIRQNQGWGRIGEAAKRRLKNALSVLGREGTISVEGRGRAAKYSLQPRVPLPSELAVSDWRDAIIVALQQQPNLDQNQLEKQIKTDRGWGRMGGGAKKSLKATLKKMEKEGVVRAESHQGNDTYSLLP